MKTTFLFFLILVLTVAGHGQGQKTGVSPAMARYGANDFMQGIDECTLAIRVNPENARAFNYRGIAKLEFHDYPGAIADFSMAAELNPKDASAWYNRELQNTMPMITQAR